MGAPTLGPECIQPAVRTVDLPPPSQAASPLENGASRRPKRILVVDDHPGIRQLNARVLSRSGYQVECAEDGRCAWATLCDSGFDLLITDHDMPIMTGVELVKKMRGAQMAMPVILATASLPEEELRREAQLEIAAMLLKPFTAGELIATVEAVLRAMHGQDPQAD